MCVPFRPIADKRARYTAAETQKFALASEELLSDLVPDTEPVWLCWRKHVAYLRVMLQDAFTPQDIVKLDNLIYEHQTLFANVSNWHMLLTDFLLLGLTPLRVSTHTPQVAEYQGFQKPKHHFAQHVPVDIINHGPARGYWCFSFEGMHQKIKAFSVGSTFVNICKRVAGLWSRDFAHAVYARFCKG